MNAIFTKNYARKADARKAAIKAGLQDGTFNVVEVEGRFGIAPVKAVKGEKGIKTATAYDLLRKGTTAQEIMATNAWAKHTVTNFLCTVRTVDLVEVARTRNEAGEFVYKIAA